MGARLKVDAGRSFLRRALEEKLGNGLVFRTFDWRGPNRQSQRMETAGRLATFMGEVVAEFPAADHFIVGHSHGGLISIYAADNPGLPSVVKGIVCLSTPFLSATRRHHGQLLYAMLGVVAVLLALYAVSAMGFAIALAGGMQPGIVVPAFPGSETLRRIPLDMELSSLALFLKGATAITLLGALILLGARILRLLVRRQCIAAKRYPAPKGGYVPIVAIAVAGDEVMSVFWALDGLATLFLLLLHPIAWIGIAVVSVALSLMAPSALDAARVSIVESWTPLTLLWRGVIEPQFWLLLTLDNRWVGVLFFVSSIFSILLFGFLLAVAFNFVAQKLVVGVPSRAFLDNFLLRIGFSQTPALSGQAQFIELNGSFSVLPHSAPYRREEGVDHIVGFFEKERTKG